MWIKRVLKSFLLMLFLSAVVRPLEILAQNTRTHLRDYISAQLMSPLSVQNKFRKSDNCDSTYFAWSRQYSSNVTPSYDIATGLAVDNNGNSYVAIRNGVSEATISVVKYDRDGNELWRGRFDEPGEEQPRGVAVDHVGNVYVTGFYTNREGNWDYITIKFNEAGQKKWVARYNSPIEASESPTYIAVDDSGNVYVTGTGYSAVPVSEKLITIKYNTDGKKLWVAQHSALGDGARLTVDEKGNVYVIGRSIANSPTAFVTVKYNVRGLEQWSAQYAKPQSEVNLPSDIVVDDKGYVYVTGRTSGSGLSDYVTIKYDSLGQQKWAVSYNGPGGFSDDIAVALHVDHAGNVYVSGTSVTLSNSVIATIKYNHDGIEQWVARYASLDQVYEGSAGLQLDKNGNIFVAGTSDSDYVVIKYNPAGAELWMQKYDFEKSRDVLAHMAVDASGNAYVTGYVSGATTRWHDIVTIKYNSNGTRDWVTRFDGPGTGQDYATALAADKNGNVYVTGRSGFLESSDYATVKYDASGKQVWAARYNGIANNPDEAKAIAVDEEGNVYVTGWSMEADRYLAIATVKYDASGQELWAARHDGQHFGHDEPSALAVDSHGNVYVAGYVSASAFEWVVLKYNNLGALLWKDRYRDTRSSNAIANAIALDHFGSLYVTGTTYQGETSDIVTIKFNVAGTREWIMSYDGPANHIDEPAALALDSNGNVYVAGSSVKLDSLYHRDFCTIKYSPNGVEEWVARYDGPAGLTDAAKGIYIDHNDFVYVAGTSSNGSTNDILTIKYDGFGEEQWVRCYSDSEHRDNFVQGLVGFDTENKINLYVAVGGIGTYNGNVVLQYDGEGNFCQAFRNPEITNSASMIRTDSHGNVFVAGASGQPGNGSGFVTMKYARPQPAKIPQNYFLSQNFPNPFNNATTIRFGLPQDSKVTLSVFNTLGQRIVDLINENRKAGEFELSWVPSRLPSGVYLYRLTAGEFVQSKKLVLLK